MGFVIDDHDIQVQKATIYARLHDPYWCRTYNNGCDFVLRWYITILGSDSSPDAESGDAPELHCYLLPFTDRDWRVLSGAQFRWQLQSHSITSMSCELRMWEYFPLHTGAITMGDWQSDLVNVDINGQTARHRVLFHGRLQFSGVHVAGNENDDDQRMANRLSEFLDTSLLESEPIEIHEYSYESGVRMASKQFLPRPQAAQ